MSIHDDIATIEAAAAGFAPPPVPFAVLTVGEVRFTAYDDDAEDGDVWFRNRESLFVFCKNQDGSWYCSLGSVSETSATPELALAGVLRAVARDARALRGSGTALVMRGAQ